MVLAAAAAVSGVAAIVTSADLPDLTDKIANLGEGSVNLADLGANVLAHGKVLYKGHAVAAVAATTIHIAEEAARLIDAGQIKIVVTNVFSLDEIDQAQNIVEGGHSIGKTVIKIV